MRHWAFQTCNRQKSTNPHLSDYLPMVFSVAPLHPGYFQACRGSTPLCMPWGWEHWIYTSGTREGEHLDLNIGEQKWRICSTLLDIILPNQICIWLVVLAARNVFSFDYLGWCPQLATNVFQRGWKQAGIFWGLIHFCTKSFLTWTRHIIRIDADDLGSQWLLLSLQPLRGKATKLPGHVSMS